MANSSIGRDLPQNEAIKVICVRDPINRVDKAESEPGTRRTIYPDRPAAKCGLVGSAASSHSHSLAGSPMVASLAILFLDGLVVAEKGTTKAVCCRNSDQRRPGAPSGHELNGPRFPMGIGRRREVKTQQPWRIKN